MAKHNLPAIATVLCECVQCKARREIGPGEVEPGMTPVCEKCYGPMFAVSAEVRFKREGR